MNTALSTLVCLFLSKLDCKRILQLLFASLLPCYNYRACVSGEGFTTGTRKGLLFSPTRARKPRDCTTVEASLAQLHLPRGLISNGIRLLYFGHIRQWRFSLLYELEVKQRHR